MTTLWLWEKVITTKNNQSDKSNETAQQEMDSQPKMHNVEEIIWTDGPSGNLKINTVLKYWGVLL